MSVAENLALIQFPLKIVMTLLELMIAQAGCRLVGQIACEKSFSALVEG